jgi:hypothetical protein
MNQIGSVSKSHQAAEDEDYLKSVFDQYSMAGKDRNGESTGVDILTKEKMYAGSMDIIMKWNDLPEQNTRKYLEQKFDKTWTKFDVNKQGFIDETEAFQFERQLMGTFNGLMDGVDTGALGQTSSAKAADPAVAAGNDAELNKMLDSLI